MATKTKVKSKVKTPSKIKSTNNIKSNLIKNSLLSALAVSVLGAGLIGINKVKKDGKLKEEIKNKNDSERIIITKKQLKV